MGGAARAGNGDLHRQAGNGSESGGTVAEPMSFGTTPGFLIGAGDALLRIFLQIDNGLDGDHIGRPWRDMRAKASQAGQFIDPFQVDA